VTPSRILSDLYHGSKPGENKLSAGMHPAIHDVGLKLITDSYLGTNQTTVAILLALKEVVRDFEE